MEKKDYIYIYDDRGKKLKMELILAMNSADGKNQYIAYKEEDKIMPIYMAKIYIKDGLMDLDTNLTQEERYTIKQMLKKKIVGGIDE